MKINVCFKSSLIREKIGLIESDVGEGDWRIVRHLSLALDLIGKWTTVECEGLFTQKKILVHTPKNPKKIKINPRIFLRI